MRLVHRDLVPGNAHHRDVPWCWQELCVEQASRDCGEGVSPKPQMCEGNQRMGLPTAKGGLQAMNRRHGVIASRTPKHLCQYRAEPLRGIGRLAEELLGIRIERMDWRRPASVTIRDLTQAGREDFWIKGT